MTANISIGVGALSYAGELNTVVADRQLCPDLVVFVDGLERALDALGRSILGLRATSQSSFMSSGVSISNS